MPTVRTPPPPPAAPVALTDAQIEQRALDGLPATEGSLADTGAPATVGLLGALAALGLGVRLTIPWSRRRRERDHA
ncbi:hypothetical protein [Mariniluteicoccus flavus]